MPDDGMSDDFQDMIDQQDAHERAQVIDLIRDIADTERAAKPLTQALDSMKAKLKQYMLLNIADLDRDQDDKPLVWHPDLSTGYVLTEVYGREADVVSMAKSNASEVLDMALAGALKVDFKLVDAHPGAGWKETLKRFTFNAGKTIRMDKKGK